MKILKRIRKGYLEFYLNGVRSQQQQTRSNYLQISEISFQRCCRQFLFILPGVRWAMSGETLTRRVRGVTSPAAMAGYVVSAWVLLPSSCLPCRKAGTGPQGVMATLAPWRKCSDFLVALRKFMPWTACIKFHFCSWRYPHKSDGCVVNASQTKAYFYCFYSYLTFKKAK